MLTIAWREPTAGARPEAEQAARPVHSRPYFDEGIASLPSEGLSPATADFEEGIVRHAGPVETEGRIAVSVGKSTEQTKETEPGTIPATERYKQGSRSEKSRG